MATWIIKDYVDRAARECSITPPASWLSSTDPTHVQFKDFLADTVREMLNRHDWEALTSDETFTGSGSASFSLPADFFRVCAEDNAVYETSPMRRRVLPMPVHGDWTETETWNFTGVQRYFRLKGSTIEFLSTLPVGAVVKMAYIQDTWALGASAERLNVWTNTSDTSLIPGYLLQLGLIWRWRRNKGLVYADRKAEFESEFARACGDDGPSRKVNFTGPPHGEQHPMRVPIIDFIPPS